MLKIKTRFSSIKKRYELLRFAEGVSARKKLNRLFKIRDKIFFKKKLPESENYPYKLIDPFEIFGEDHPYGDFNLVGENWKDKINSKPLAILWGFNNWKLGFTSAYLPEYRTAFAPRKIRGFLALLAIRRFPIKPSVFIVWGYSEPLSVKLYANFNKIKIYRMEDGFVRSSELGACHSVPYSLVIDKSGLHYNPHEVSDLESILKDYNFTDNKKLMSEALNAYNLIVRHGITKYNPPRTSSSVSIKTKVVVAVLGQVKNDASLKYGNPDGWDYETIVKLAAYENPECEILYRPHPEVFFGYQKNFIKSRRIQNIAKIVSPEKNFDDFIDEIDVVYTISSLSGFEALLRGKKVITFGAPFYAGWGLTEDRAVIESRGRKLTVLELFAGAYLMYPRYLADLDDNYLGIVSSCVKINVDKHIAYDKLKYDEVINERDKLSFLVKTYKWSGLLSNSRVLNDSSLLKFILARLPYNEIFEDDEGCLYPRILTGILLGLMPDIHTKGMVLKYVRPYLSAIDLSKVLLDLESIDIRYREITINNWAWLLGENNDHQDALDLISQAIFDCGNSCNRVCDDTKNNIFVNSSDGCFNPDINDLLLVKFESLINKQDHSSALQVAIIALMNGAQLNVLMDKVINLCNITFDYKSARKLSLFCQGISLTNKNGSSVVGEFQSARFSICGDYWNHLLMLARTVTLRPDLILGVLFNLDLHNKHYGPFEKKLILSLLNYNNDFSLQKVKACLLLERFEDAKGICEELAMSDVNVGLLVIYSQVLSYVGLLSDAVDLLRRATEIEFNAHTIGESLRLFILTGNYKEAYYLIQKADSKRIPVGNMYRRKVLFGCRMLKEAFYTFVEMDVRNVFAKYYPDKYYDCNLKDNLVCNKLILIAIFGPGDEIRFSSVYPYLRSIYQFVPEIVVTCSPKTYSIFSRSFPDLKFLPVPRIRTTDPIDLNEYKRVPGFDISGFINNDAVDEIESSDSVQLITDTLHQVYENYQSFTGKPFLTCDPQLLLKFTSSLSVNKFLIGLSWRSSLTTHSRNEHYLSIEELEPIFRFEELQFVNFQYDECQEELDWVEARYPGKLINISDIDQYNDFESVAALMKCMDLMIAPATTVVELSGALGCPTWLLSNSSELFWRKIDDQGTDVWHRSITHVEGKVLGDKASLVAELCTRLSNLTKSLNTQMLN